MQIIMNNLLKGKPYPSVKNNRIVGSKEKKVDRKKYYHKDKGLVVNDKKLVTEYTVEIHTAKTTREIQVKFSSAHIVNANKNSSNYVVPEGTEVWLICETPDRRERGIKPLFRFYFPKQKYSFPLYEEEFEWSGKITKKVIL